MTKLLRSKRKVATFLGLFVLLPTTPAVAQKWPLEITPQKDLGSYQASTIGGNFLYETRTYQVTSPQEIDPTLLENFILSAESVTLALKAIPLSLFSPQNKKKALIKIVFDETSYLSAGGAPGTGGFYHGFNNSVIIRWDQLNQRTKHSTLLHRPTFDLLVHELTHLCMGEQIWKMKTWLFEGVAEYLAAAHLNEGRFDFRKIETQIRDHIRKQSAQDTEEIPATKINTLLQLSSQDWLNRNATLAPRTALEAYTSALLLTHYAFHGGSERLERVREYLMDLAEIKFQKEPKPSLFSTNKAAVIEKQIKNYWNTRGLKLIFK